MAEGVSRTQVSTISRSLSMASVGMPLGDGHNHNAANRILCKINDPNNGTAIEWKVQPRLVKVGIWTSFRYLT